jgi:CheY-like chemotaxis protein
MQSSAHDASGKARILCVDDEPAVLDGLSLHLGRRYELLTANSGSQALRLLESESGVAVVISDMRMPAMDGATFLSKARRLAPDAVRMLLTGETDRDSAVAAINDGQIFRFLTKPTPPTVLLNAVEAALDQHRLITAERVLLEQTLVGSMKTLSDILALTSPVTFGRSTRIRELVCTLAEKLGIERNWELETAAMLSELGCVSLPDATMARVHSGERISPDEQAMLTRANQLTEQLLSNIPRLETVRRIVAVAVSSGSTSRSATLNQDTKARTIDRIGMLIRLALEFDTLEVEGNSPAVAIDTIRGRGPRYEPAAMSALEALRCSDAVRQEVRELGIGELRPGMVFVEDVRLRNGVLLVARGYEVTPSFLARVRNHQTNVIVPLRVRLPPRPVSGPIPG